MLLSTGLAADAVGPNDAADTGDGVGGPGSDLLTTDTGSPTFDAATFELDFTLDAGFDGIELNYAFATEEFPEFTGEGLGDALRIFVDGVSVGGADTASGGFLDNSGTIDADGLVVPASAPLDIEFDGITSTLTAVALNLDEGPHTLTIVLADVDDEFVDSAVFLSSLEGTIIPTPSAAVAGLALLAAGAARRRRPARPESSPTAPEQGRGGWPHPAARGPAPRRQAPRRQKCATAIVVRPGSCARLGIYIVGDDEAPAGRRCSRVAHSPRECGGGGEQLCGSA